MNTSKYQTEAAPVAESTVMAVSANVERDPAKIAKIAADFETLKVERASVLNTAEQCATVLRDAAITVADLKRTPSSLNRHAKSVATARRDYDTAIAEAITEHDNALSAFCFANGYTRGLTPAMVDRTFATRDANINAMLDEHVANAMLCGRIVEIVAGRVTTRVPTEAEADAMVAAAAPTEQAQ